MGSEGEVERAGWKTPGFLVSGGAHAALLVFLLVHFATAPEMTNPPETVQVDLVDDPANDISMGEKTAKLMPTPQRRVDKLAEVEDHHPLPPTERAVKDTPSLDSPDKANDDPGHGDKPAASLPPPPMPMPPERPVERPVEKVEAPTPPARPVEVAKAEPAKPEPAKPDPAKPAKPEPAKETSKDEPDAEALAPKPPPRPKTPPKEQPKQEAKDEAKELPKELPKPPKRPAEKKVAKVLPPKRPETEPKPEPAVVPPPRPEPPEKPEKPSLFDQVASLLKKEPPAPKPRAGNETKDAHPHDDFNPDKISSLLDHDTAQRRASTGRSLTKMAALGLPNAHAEKLSPSMAAQIDNWLIDHYRGCWSYFGLGGTQDYVPQLRISMAQDGTLIGQPALINPPRDPNLRSLADSAIRAVNRCNPMEIPTRFKPYYDQGYKDRVVRFDPKEMS